jgi:iron complex transport system substrate-binding protein
MHNKKFAIILLLLFVMLLAACNGEKNEEKSSDEDTNKVKVMEDAKGEVEIPANPKRIIAPYLEDSLVALGVTPVAQWSIGETVLGYLQPQLGDVPKIGWDVPLEQAISYDPDLIIFSSPSAIQEGLYEEYTKIAPTYVFKDEVSSDWREQLRVMGEIVNKKEKAETLLDNYDKKVADAKEKLKQAISDESVAVMWVTNKQFFVIDETRHSGNVLYGDLGIKVPEFVKNLPTGSAAWDPVTLEKLSELDADHIFLINTEGAVGVEEIYANPIWKGLNAVKKGQVYEMTDTSNWTISGLVANEKTIDELLKALVK